jgi:hypothetical protein
MKSKVADEARRARIERELAMMPAERVALALRLGRRALELRARTAGATLEEARRQLAAERRQGRRVSRCASR